MSWLLPVMALDVVDEVVVNAKVVRALPVYSSIMTTYLYCNIQYLISDQNILKVFPIE